MATITKPRATLDDLYRTEGKAELIGGEIVRMANGHLPGRVAENIFFDLRLFSRATKKGQVHADGVGFAVPEMASGRESFSPDTSYYDGPITDQSDALHRRSAKFSCRRFVARTTTATSPSSKWRRNARTADYFLAGTLVVWDVDPIAETVAVYRKSAPDQPSIFRRGDVADAEPAVPGWRMKVDDIFAA